MADFDKVAKAERFAFLAHKGQRRKYTDEPYILHPMRVATRMSQRTLSNDIRVAAAWLHDVVEDCEVTLEDIELFFGYAVALIVGELTNTPKTDPSMNRAVRMKMDKERLSKASASAKIIKLLDRIDNLNDLPLSKVDVGYVKMYLQESRELLEVIKDGDAELAAELASVIENKTRELEGM